MRHAEFITVPASINVACLGGRDFDGPRTLLAAGSSPRDCPPMTPTHHPTGLPGPAGGGEQSTPNRPTATVPPFSNFHGPDWQPAFPPRRHTRTRLDNQTVFLLTAPARIHNPRIFWTKHAHTARLRGRKLRCLTAFPSSLVFVRFVRIGDKSERRSTSRPRLWPTQPTALPRCWFPCSMCRPQLGRSETNGGLSHRAPQTPKLEESLISRGLRGRQTEPGASDSHGG